MTEARIVGSLLPALVVAIGIFSSATPQDARSRAQSLIAERQHLDSLIASNKAKVQRLKAQKDSLQRVSGAGSLQQQTASRDAAVKIVDLKRRIAEQRGKNQVAAGRRGQMAADSAASAGKTGRFSDSVSTAIATILARRQAETEALQALTIEKSSAETAIAAREAEQRSAAEASHAAVVRLDAPIAAQKARRQESQQRYTQARNDSIAARARIDLESGQLRGALAAAEKQLAALKRQDDSLTSARQKQRSDSILARGTGDDSVRAASTRLSALRQSIAERDAALKATVTKVSDLRRDSLTTLSKYLTETRDRDASVKHLDSLIPALQAAKSGVQLVQEKLQLDSIIEALTPADGGRLSDADARKLDVYTGKREMLLRDPQVAHRLAEMGQLQWRNDGIVIASLLADDKLRLDSASAAREQLVSRGVILQSDHQKKMSAFTSQLAAASALSVKNSRELVNAQSKLLKATQDSSAAVKRRDDTDAKNQKRATALAAAQAAKQQEIQDAEKDVAARKAQLASREADWQKALEAAHGSVMKAYTADLAEKATLDSLQIRQEKLRVDSSATDKEMSLGVAQARQALQLKLEAMKMRNGQIALIDGLLSKARSDSLSALNARYSQQKNQTQARADLDRQLREGEAQIVKLEQELAVARSDSAAAVDRQRSAAGDLTARIAALEQEIVLADQEGFGLTKQRTTVENDRVAAELELQRAEAAEKKARAAAPKPATTPPAPAPVTKSPPPPVDRTPAPEPPATPALSKKQKQAQDMVTRIYQLVEQEKIKEAKKSFSSNRDLLEGNLDPEAYGAIAATMDALVETVQEAPSFPAPEKPEPPEKKAAPEKKSAAPAPIAPPAPPAQPPQPEVEPGKPATIFLSSIPPVANVYMDGQLIGKTNVGFIEVTSGKHMMQFVKGDLTCTREMVFLEGRNPTAVVKIPCK